MTGLPDSPEVYRRIRIPEYYLPLNYEDAAWGSCDVAVNAWRFFRGPQFWEHRL